MFTPTQRWLLVKTGQSNFQGPAKSLSGVGLTKHISRYYGSTEPYPLCNNAGQGGGLTPYLLDFLARRGIQADVIDGTIGGQSIFLSTGRAGWALTGTASDPATLGYVPTAPFDYSGAAGAAVLREGDVGFDPCGLNARVRAAIAARMAAQRYDRVIGMWSNGETDYGYGSAGLYGLYRDALGVQADYLLASGCTNVGVGLSVQVPNATTQQMQYLQQAVTEAVALRARASKGADLVAKYGPYAPLIPEAPPNGATRVHIDLRGQEVHAYLWIRSWVDAGLLSA